MIRHITICLVASLLTACGSIETTPPPDQNPAPSIPSDGLIAASQGFGEDPYSPGSRWYNYDGRSHVVTPRDQVYLLSRPSADDATVYMLRILSYYDEQGRSGYFQAELRTPSTSWRALPITANVKERPICIDLDRAAEVGCDSAVAQIVLRTDWRVVPAAGFSIANPAIYPLTHFTDAHPWRVTIVPSQHAQDDAKSIDALISELGPDPDAAADPRASRVGWLHDAPDDSPRPDVQIQANARSELIQWQVRELEAVSSALVFGVRCVPLAASSSAQVPFSDASITSLTVTLPAEAQDGWSGAYIKLCGQDAGVVEPFSERRAGLWPDTRSFDLIIERYQSRVSIRPAPGNVLINWSRAVEHPEGRDPTEMIDAPTPVDLWGERVGL
jgi:hypothetical protein